MIYHQPVLLKNCLDGLNCKDGGLYVDATFGGGGHAKAILSLIGKNGKLFAFDQDKDAAANVIPDERLTFIPQNFRYMSNFLRMYKVTALDGILADLGVSSHQFDVAERGFSTRFNAELDMRMNRASSKTASTIINEYAEKDLLRVFREYGEVENAGKLVRLIAEARTKVQITESSQLKEIISSCVPQRHENQYLAKVFQALRIEVNEEIESLQEFLTQSLEALKPGGRLVIVSYHSLEDRLVKNFMRSGNFEGEPVKDFYGKMHLPFRIITKKPITPNEKEIEENSRARSAKLRIAEKY